MDYEAMVPDVVKAVMAAALGQVARQGLQGEHHFYITIDSRHPGVTIPDSLRAQYPETLTIVLQHEFWDLVVSDDGFSVSLSFNGVSNKLEIPFEAVTGFADPSIHFGIQFNMRGAPVKPVAVEDKPTPKIDSDGGGDTNDGAGRVVALDSFRKK